MADVLRLLSEAERRTLPTLSRLSDNGWTKYRFFIKTMMFVQQLVFLMMFKMHAEVRVCS